MAISERDATALHTQADRALATVAAVARVWAWIVWRAVTGVCLAGVVVFVALYAYLGVRTVWWAIVHQQPLGVVVGLIPIVLPLGESALFVDDVEVRDGDE